jgi:membrane protein
VGGKMIRNRFSIIFNVLVDFLDALRNSILTLLFSLSLAGGLSIELSILLRKLNLKEIVALLSNLPFNSVELSLMLSSPILLIVTLLKLPRIKKRFKVSIISLSMILVVFAVYIIFYFKNIGPFKVDISIWLSLILFYLSFNIIYIVIELLLYLYNRMYGWLVDTNTTVEPAKLTLIWTIIAFILGLFISKK